jgi:negative regulator of sigma E activity
MLGLDIVDRFSALIKAEETKHEITEADSDLSRKPQNLDLTKQSAGRWPQNKSNKSPGDLSLFNL